ncbi:MAG: hypothetical protein FWK01_04805 [Pantanalinema sp. GBBB05]|nr:hypothetical protein [Pantanalinema sp. GBBB05]
MTLMENEILTSDLRGHRTLATVVFTDCVGFSARMSVDEDHTLDLIRRDLKLMKRICEQLEGRVLKFTGDGLLMCFSSAVKAVECAIEIQKEIAEQAAARSANDTLKHRIGIHLADIFITETDVMGNGVNIAARLQTEADPGGICVSQTVYDVVKANLHLETRYLGPRELKNIREVVPIYKILLEPDPQVSDPYSQVVYNLEHNLHLPRIKKLLFYVCKNRWENDQHQLDTLTIRDLVQELHQLAPSPEQLRGFLDAAVNTLSKQTEYSLIANIILSEVAQLNADEVPPKRTGSAYASSDVTQAFSLPDLPAEDLPTIYDRLAQELQQNSDLLPRTKKLLFYVCRRRWENDQVQLDSVSLPRLIQELHQLAPTFDRLNSLITSFVQTLNKQAEYSLIANLLIGKLHQLYGSSPAPVAPATGQATIVTTGPVSPESPPLPSSTYQLDLAEQTDRYKLVAAELDRHPDHLRIKKLMLYACRMQWESDPARLASLGTAALVQELHSHALTLEQLQTALSAIVRTVSKQAEYAAIARATLSQMSRLYSAQPVVRADVPPATSVPVADSLPVAETSLPPITPVAVPIHQSTPLEPPSSAAPLSLFDIRLGIMKYANPLRTKLLIFSALHTDFTYSHQDWLNLKMYELDGLLRSLLYTCKTYTDLELLLYEAARRLQDPEQNVQTADVLVKTLRSLYLHGSPAALLGEPDEETRLGLDEFEQTTLEFAKAHDDDEYTCQLAAPPTGLGGQTDSTVIEVSSAQPPERTHLVVNPELAANPATEISEYTHPLATSPSHPPSPADMSDRTHLLPTAEPHPVADEVKTPPG